MIDIALIKESLPLLMRGALVTLQIAGFGCIFGITLGTSIGLILASKNTYIKLPFSFFVTIIRGTPMLIQIFMMYFALPQIGINMSAFWSATLAIGLNSSAYISQVIKSGVASVGTGQLEAARVIGLNRVQIIWYIVLPQAFRVVLPALGNEFITLIKDSSLASTIGVAELAKEASIIRSYTADVLSIYIAVAIIYLIMTTSLSILISYLQNRMDRYVAS